MTNRNLVMLMLPLCVFWISQLMAGDVKGGKDDPRVGRYEGSEIRVYKHLEFDEFPYLTHAYPAGDIDRPEGALTLIGYHLPDDASFVQVARNFKQRLEAQAFSIDFECDTEKGDCGSALDFAAQIKKPSELPEPGWYDWDRWHYHFLSAHLERPEGKVYVSLWITKYANAQQPRYAYVSVLEQQAMAFKMVDAEEMASEISQYGRIALYGIYFDSAKSEIKPESQPTIFQIAQLLKQQADLRLVIVGHTDNQGSLDYNMDLSKRRATAVRDALVKGHGINAARLSAWGAGYLAPVASNRSEEGRAQNRRVELVEQ
jgi:OOP family OmpA-OmpF porin